MGTATYPAPLLKISAVIGSEAFSTREPRTARGTMTRGIESLFLFHRKKSCFLQP